MAKITSMEKAKADKEKPKEARPATRHARKSGPDISIGHGKTTLQVMMAEGADPCPAIASLALDPNVNAAMLLLKHYNGMATHQDIDLGSIILEMDKQAEAVNRGDLSRPEGMLLAQAIILDNVFTDLLQRAALNRGEYFDISMRYMMAALKAQGQSRATLETLALIKNPPNVAFVKQANIAHGAQQVNNGGQAPVRGENERSTNKLLERDIGGERLDAGTQGKAGEKHPTLATVEKLDRPQDSSR